ncbi:hypothetical protein SAMN04489812_2659 [Microlunatus soli]|uniref:PH domain-containing protein n=1 Tax=Microlunatus soli TaxID=630515 RepID=A0A1H1U891_9ACTN|nr:hypothetical protein SAMN04489812_2659 [Microlunatus soli]
MHPATTETVLYRARYALWVQLVAIGVVALLAVIMVQANLTWYREGRGPTPLTWVVSVALIAGPAVILLTGLRQSFTVTDQRLIITGAFRTRRIGWQQVRSIEVDRRLLSRGATVVVLTDGCTVHSPITAARVAIRRGEQTVDHGPDLLHPARPTQAARAAHRRHLIAR